MKASEDKLKQVLADVFDVDAGIVDETTSVDTVEKWDSLNHMIFIVALEAEFNVTLKLVMELSVSEARL